jgi:hypothetical protein
MIAKNAYKEAVTQNFSVISYILPELYDDEVRILAAAIKISHVQESSSARESLTS